MVLEPLSSGVWKPLPVLALDDEGVYILTLPWYEYTRRPIPIFLHAPWTRHQVRKIYGGHEELVKRPLRLSPAVSVPRLQAMDSRQGLDADTSILGC
jgi:hypothetical protein